MRFDVTASQLSHFHKNHSIVFEGFLTESELLAVNSHKSGHDLWRHNPEIKKILVNKEIGELLYELTLLSPLMILQDKVIQNETINLPSLPFQTTLMGLFFPFGSSEMIIFKADHPPVGSGLLAIYAKHPCTYVFKSGETALKKLGYAYGDTLEIKDFPLVYKLH